MSDPGDLVMWVVYDHPRDFPDQFVARKWTVLAGAYGPTREVLAAGTLEEVRDQIREAAPFAVHMMRSKLDDPKIMETWL